MSLERCPCFNLGLAHRRVVRAFEDALAPLELTMAQAHFLGCLYRQDGQLSRDLARQLAVDACTLTPMIDRLERMGLIRRSPHPDDRRATRLCLEPAGRAIERELTERCCAVSSRLAAKFSPGDYDRFLSALSLFAEEAPEAEPALVALTHADAASAG